MLRMKRKKKRSEAAYLYIIGALMFLLDKLKKAVVGLIKHITGLLSATLIIGCIIVANAFDRGEINFISALLFIIILLVLLAALIKIKLLESEG